MAVPGSRAGRVQPTDRRMGHGLPANAGSGRTGSGHGPRTSSSKCDVVLHHDRGSQYTSASYRAKAEAANILPSMSRPRMPYDNAMAESFFSTLQLEPAPDKAFASREAARLA